MLGARECYCGATEGLRSGGYSVKDQPIFPVSPLENVREGMVVVDSQGRRIGTVKRMRLGYPEAVTAEGDDLGDRPAGVAVAASPTADNIQPVAAAIPVMGEG